jgi:hypothetical protein
MLKDSLILDALAIRSINNSNYLSNITNTLAGRNKKLGRCEGGVMTLVITPRDEF